MSDMQEKIARVRALLKDKKLDAAAFSSQANFAWLTGGADNHVGLATEAGASTVVVTNTAAFVLADNIEAPRVEAEETGSLDLEVIDYPWWEGRLEERITALVGSDKWAADFPCANHPDIEPLMYPLRADLTDTEVETYRRLGKITGQALQTVAETVEIGHTELEVAGEAAEFLISRGVTPQTLLVASDERLESFRHPIPKPKRIGRSCLIVIGARMNGLICTASRIVHFGRPPEDLTARHKAVCTVDAVLQAHTVPGETVGDAFKAGVRAYAEQGFQNEWMLHHQGGPTGYKPREFRATAGSPQTIRPRQPFAWNPTITGTKSENTILAGEPVPEILTLTPEWPTIVVDSPNGPVRQPAILVK